ncbi:GGDEF domain-containing protein [Jiella marina]|uniref:GGDEF domain-containing protein n=1 Tax=Jiella sp. LLJ827 TaxID=2917712 RepID=UPI0021007465|nr:GGDEF domain-containing protein [Jiella sp. LLJ827]MCQ0986353.1 GGDEF domain-containing protein [Jiella sp. LLJ827]
MKRMKSELPVALLIIMMIAAASALYIDNGLIKGVLDESADAKVLRLHGFLTYSSIACLAAGLVLTVFWIWPLMQHHTKEQGKLQSLTGLLKERSQKLETEALTDALTGMHNRRFFDEALSQYLAEFGRIGKPVGLVLIDLDHFKSINDNYGHDVGDEVLRSVALCLFEFSRYHDVVARLGGEEFAIIAPNMGHDELRRFADRLRAEIAGLQIAVAGNVINITASFGIHVTFGKETPQAIMKRVDVNLYRAKQTGRNLVCA